MSSRQIPVLDKCPGYNLYIGGFIGLRRTEVLQACNITHILSVLTWQFEDDSPLIKGYQHLHIPVDDVEDENLLEWFPRSNAFIAQALRPQSPPSNDLDRQDRTPGGVFIHCAMGKSRSATVLLAYLLWASRQPSSSETTVPSGPLSVIQALELLRQGRPIAEPNEGFMQQLHMYEDMGCPTTEDELTRHKIYRRWMNRRRVEESVRVMQAPEMEHIIFEDDVQAESIGSETQGDRHVHMQEIAPGLLAPDGSDRAKALSHTKMAMSPQATIKCRKCRHVLATTPFILEHKPPPHKDPAFERTAPIGETPLPPSQCGHIFLHPLSWMKEVLGEGSMEGRLVCPSKKCGTNIGKFAWTGLRCSCGGWVTPGFALIRTKVDESLSKAPLRMPTADGTSTAATSLDDASGGSPQVTPGGIRLPPHMRGRGNL